MRAMFFGDSLTYGHGLPDCVLPGSNGAMTSYGTEPSKLGWAAMVAEELCLPYINQSSPGASNLEILWTLRQSAVTVDDLVIVEWSYPVRDCLLDHNITKIGPWVDDDINRRYYGVHPTQDLINRNNLVVEHTALFLDKIGSKWLFFANSYEDYNEESRKMIIDCFDHHICDTAEDGNHPGMVSNQNWAKVVLNHVQARIENRSWEHGVTLPDSTSFR